ncbi:hypothetical protein D3C73_1308190 [compost metagenome]
MRHDPCFVVCSTAAIQPAVPFLGDKRFRIPKAPVPRWLDVVVRVEQNGRLAFGGGSAGDDGRTTGRTVVLVTPKDPDVLHACFLNQGRNGVGASIQFRWVETRPRNARNANQFLQGRECALEGVVDRRGQCLDRSGAGLPLLVLRDLRMC